MAETPLALGDFVSLIRAEVQAAVRREMAALTATDQERAAFIDAFARTRSGQPNANQAAVRERANTLVLRLEHEAGNR